LFGGPFRGHDEACLRELSLRMMDVPQFNGHYSFFGKKFSKKNFTDIYFSPIQSEVATR
jgi:hypothetical protein